MSPVCWSLRFCIKDIVIFSTVLNCSIRGVWISLDSATDENKLETGCCCIRVLTLEVRNIWTRVRSFLSALVFIYFLTLFTAVVKKKIQTYYKLTKPFCSSSFASGFFVHSWHQNQMKGLTVFSFPSKSFDALSLSITLPASPKVTSLS